MHKRSRVAAIILIVLLAALICFLLFRNRFIEPKGPTVKKLLKAAMEPVGQCLYVYGGGWAEDGSGAAEETMTIGVSPNWYRFFRENDTGYDYEKITGHYHDGLDCSGYIGYAVYQVFQNSYNENGYVFISSQMPEVYAEMFQSEVISANKVTEYRPGDIMGIKGHVAVAIGTCEDGSLLFLHASPPVVSLCGTPTPEGDSESQAIALAERYMKKYFPECSEKYQNWSRGASYLTKFRLMRWNRDVLSDPEGLDRMSPEEILREIIGR